MSQSLIARDQRKAEIFAIRKKFFENLLREWTRPPEEIDDVMGQSAYFIEPEEGPGSVSINDPERGLLVRSFSSPRTWGKKVRFSYSIWVAGEQIRYGVLLQADVNTIQTFQSRSDCTSGLERVFDCPADFMVREGGLLMEWRFTDANFYDDYVVEDRYLQIARHLHFHLGQSIHEVFVDEAFAQ